MNEQDRHSKDSAGDPVWLYLLAGYVVGFVAARMLSRRGSLGEKSGAFLGGLGVALSGRSLGNPWHM